MLRNVVMMLALLFAAFGLARVSGMEAGRAGCLGMAALLAFTALGHFVQTAGMQEMIPPGIPARRVIVIGSGFVELGLAVALCVPAWSRTGAAVAMAFLVLATPLNISSALRRVPFGGHGVGPRYLLVRLPLQAFLVGWLWWFGLRA